MPIRPPSFWTTRGGTASLLLPVAALYQLGYRIRRAMTVPVQLEAKLLCIGNLVAGGAGKTPVAIAIGEHLRERGIHACFLSKGYGGRLTAPTLVDAGKHTAADVGDEPLLLARTLPTVVARDRARGAAFAQAQGFSLIIADDGFQNPNLRPDVALVVADAAYGFGNGHTLPAGPLREPVAYGLARADALVAVYRGDAAENRLPDIPLPVIAADLHTTCPPEAAQHKLLAFCGIARPEQFFRSLAEQDGITLAGCHAFADHHPFRTEELDMLAAEAQHLDAALITTAKDAVRLPDGFRDKVLVAKATLNWHNSAELEAVLAPLIALKEP